MFSWISFYNGFGNSVFFVDEVEPFRWIWGKIVVCFWWINVTQLTVYPAWMQSIAAWTPFPVILGGRSGLVFNFDLVNVSFICLSAGFWILVGFLLLMFLYRKGLKSLNIQGG